MSINEQLEDGLPLEDYIEQNQDQFNLSAGEVSQDTWIVYNEDQNVRVAHREDKDDLDGLEFVYNTFQQLKNELEEIVDDGGRYTHFKDQNSEGEPQHTIYDKENNQEAWIQSTEMYSLGSNR